MEDDENQLAGELADASALSDVMTDLETRSQRFGAALTGALKSAASGGKGLEDVLRGLGNRLSDIALSAGLKPLENLIGTAVGSLFGTSAAAAAGGGSAISSMLQGGSGAGGKAAAAVTPFADGGIVRAPSYFPMDDGQGGGLGLMGEAGAEAILPLRRGADGALGVATGGGEAASPSIVFNVTATDAASFRKSEGQISAMLARSVARGRRAL